MNTWLTVLSIVLGSSLTLEIYRNIKEAAHRKHEKNILHDELPNRLDRLEEKVDQIATVTTTEFTAIKGRLDEDKEHFAKIDEGLSQMQTAINRNAEGTELGLANDIVIFNAFRNHHINGESEIAERRVNDYLLRNMKDSYSVK